MIYMRKKRHIRTHAKPRNNGPHTLVNGNVSKCIKKNSGKSTFIVLDDTAIALDVSEHIRHFGFR